VLRRLPRQIDPNVLVGFDTNDDAGVYRLSDDLALVQTVDFFTPIVDDPYLYGQIAAANSLSDVYAMGGRPLCALSIVGFPEKGDPDLMEQVLRGGLSKMQEAHCSVVGGHSIRDDDLKFGYAVTGVINPERVWRNVGAQPADTLLLTKPVGTGVISTALKKNRAAAESLAASVASMTRLNLDAAEAFREADGSVEFRGTIHAVTDITGFGLLGHAQEMAAGSNVSFEIDHTRVEYLPGAVEAARQGHLAGGLKNNREFVGHCTTFAETVPEEFRSLLYDPQTSGGLLVAIPARAVDGVLAALGRHGVAARAIGRVIPKRSPLIRVI
jgi:selenide, water dikinase